MCLYYVYTERICVMYIHLYYVFHIPLREIEPHLEETRTGPQEAS